MDSPVLGGGKQDLTPYFIPIERELGNLFTLYIFHTNGESSTYSLEIYVIHMERSRQHSLSRCHTYGES